MIRIGITGGIGSGKSLVCDIFRRLGIPVYVADTEAKLLMNNNLQTKQALVAKFGGKIYRNNLLNRELLAGIIFEDKTALDFVNAIVHPEVAIDFERWSNKQTGCSYVIEEAALLYESGAYKRMDKIITVYAPEDIRIERVAQRDRISVSQINKRIQNQLSDEEKVKRSDFVIYNDDKHSVLEQVLNLHHKFLSSNK